MAQDQHCKILANFFCTKATATKYLLRTNVKKRKKDWVYFYEACLLTTTVFSGINAIRQDFVKSCKVP